MSGSQQLPTSHPWRPLEQFLLHGDLPAQAVQPVRAARLGAYAYAHLDAGHPSRSEFRTSHLSVLYQHLTTRAAVHGLLRAWHEAGIEALLFKGFHLSEFVYPAPGQRPYGDVDILIRPGDARRAAEIATGLGWRETWRVEASLVPHHHELMHLQSRDGQVQLDVHRRVLHNLLPGSRLQQRVTGRVWAAATRQDWDGVPVRLPDPRDALLVGLVLQRAWGNDSWVLKAHDWPDFRALVRRHDLGLDSLRRRARELGCARTFEVFLSVCDAYHHRLSLRPRTRGEYLWWSARTLPERPLLLFEHTLYQGWTAWQKGRDLLRELPHVLRAVREVGRAHDLPGLLAAVPAGPSPSAPRLVDEREVQHTLRGVELALRRLRVRPRGDRLEYALAVYRALRVRGYAPVFCRGVAPGSADPHTWVELAGAPLPDPARTEDPGLYRRTFEFPVTRPANGGDRAP